MMLVEETTVLSAALPVAEFKEHLRLGSGFDDDGLQETVLESFLRASIAAIEARTGKALLERPFAWTLPRWRDAARQPLPVAPVSALAEVSLVDRMGEAVVVAPSVYRLVPDAQHPELRPVGNCLPSIPSEGQAEVRFLAGYGPDWSDVPADLRQAVMLLAAHYYEYRDDMALSGGCMPFGVTSLIERYRAVRLGAGA
ncbi:head-tail connector protein [Shimia sp.]|uniref:head-tail connector protein n=1 Tax=Shimia sp. TaxID=1954381 RepID=UPI00356A1E37